jgi:hypothetical protein
VVISDKPIAHDTQRAVPDYRRVIRDGGVMVRRPASAVTC